MQCIRVIDACLTPRRAPLCTEHTGLPARSRGPAVLLQPRRRGRHATGAGGELRRARHLWLRNVLPARYGRPGAANPL